MSTYSSESALTSIKTSTRKTRKKTHRLLTQKITYLNPIFVKYSGKSSDRLSDEYFFFSPIKLFCNRHISSPIVPCASLVFQNFLPKIHYLCIFSPPPPHYNCKLFFSIAKSGLGCPEKRFEKFFSHSNCLATGTSRFPGLVIFVKSVLLWLVRRIFLLKIIKKSFIFRDEYFHKLIVFTSLFGAVNSHRDYNLGKNSASCWVSAILQCTYFVTPRRTDRRYPSPCVDFLKLGLREVQYSAKFDLSLTCLFCIKFGGGGEWLVMVSSIPLHLPGGLQLKTGLCGI